MALYWQREKVALDIVDDPFRRPFEGDDSYRVLRVTCAELLDYESYLKVARKLCELLGNDMPSSPEWEVLSRALHERLAQNILDSLKATDELIEEEGGFPTLVPEKTAGLESDEENPFMGKNMPLVINGDVNGDRLCERLGKSGQQASISDVWDGPVPPGSYTVINDRLSMSTAEFFFLRKANKLPFAEAVWYGIELCGKFCTSRTKSELTDEYDFIREPRTDKAELQSYLRSIAGMKECKRARRVLSYVLEQCCTPMGCYLYILLCLPRTRGSYAMEKPQLSAAYDADDGFLPAATGDYMAYDLCWMDKHVALQYTGSSRPNLKDLQALRASNMQVLCITDEDIADPKRFDEVAHELAKLLHARLPQDTEQWVRKRDKLREQITLPDYSHMRLTLDDIYHHRVI